MAVVYFDKSLGASKAGQNLNFEFFMHFLQYCDAKMMQKKFVGPTNVGHLFDPLLWSVLCVFTSFLGC